MNLKLFPASRKKCGVFFGLSAALLTLASDVTASPLDQLTPKEREAVFKCVQLIRERHLDSGTAKGAFRVANDSDNAWIEHYFVLEACLALLATTDDPNSADVESVGEYLTFYATDALKQPQGVAHNFEGPKDNPPYLLGGNKDYDSIDSYAGLFLLASARYYKLTGQLPPNVSPALLVSLQALNRVINDKANVCREGGLNPSFSVAADTNELPIARDNYGKHQLIDAVETHAGLRESVELFQKLGKSAQATQALNLANGIVRGVPSLDYVERKYGGFDQYSGRFAVYLDEQNVPVFGSTRGNDALPSLVAAAYISSPSPTHDSKLWNYLKSTWTPDDTEAAPGAPSERWLIASTRVAPAEAADWRERVATNALGSDTIPGFGAGTYIDRLAVTILALVDGSARYPLLQLPQGNAKLLVGDAHAVDEGSASSPGTLMFPVTLTATSTQTIKVKYQTADNVARAGQDYAATSGTLTFAPGETLKFVPVKLIGDAVPEANENFYLNLSSPNNASILTARGLGTINNDDGPKITINDAASVMEGNSGTKSQTFTVRLSAATSTAATVDWATAYKTAYGDDFISAKGTLTFNPGETSKTITIKVKGDTISESDESYVVNLSHARFAVLGNFQGVATIRNDDQAFGSAGKS